MTRRPWDPSEDTILCRHYGRISATEIAANLGRSRWSVLHHARKLGVRFGRRWTVEQDQVLREMHGTATAAEIGRRVGRSAKSVHQRAWTLGLAARHEHFNPDGKLANTIRGLHQRQYSDAEIAAAVKRDRRWISELRARLGLPPNGHSERFRRRVAKNTRRQCRAAGVKSLAEVRVLAFRRFAREHGWPEDLRPRAVQILDVLWQRGPMTRRQICEAIGMRWKGSRASLSSNDPEGSYLAHLVARGLVVQLGRCVKDRGRGKSTNLYSIAPGVRPERSERS